MDVLTGLEGATAAITPAMAIFVFATTAAPGPNAALMLATGARAGIAAGLPVLMGLALANALAKGAIAAGIRLVAELHPIVIGLGQWIAVALTLWLAWRLMRRLSGLGERQGVGGFADAFAFQLVNPKVWITGLAAATLFCSPEIGGIGHALGFAVVAFPSVVVGAGAWLLIGHMGAVRLRGPRAVRLLNLAVGATLLAALAPVLLA